MSRPSRLALGLAAVGAAALTAVAPGTALANGDTGAGKGNNGGGQEHVTICHATGSESNPFVKIGPAEPGVVYGHLGGDHQDGRDVIPPFEYEGKTYSQNWDAAGEALLAADCKVKDGGQIPADGNGLGAELLILGSLPVAAGAVLLARRRND